MDENKNYAQLNLSEKNFLVWFMDNSQFIVYSLLYLIAAIMLLFSDFDSFLRIFAFIFCIVFVSILYFLYMKYYLTSRKERVLKAILKEDKTLSVYCNDKIRSMKFEDILFSVTYTTFKNVLFILVSENDYVIVSMSSGYALSKFGDEQTKEYYKMHKFYKNNSPVNIDIIKSRYNKEKSWMKIPFGIFDINLYDKRAQSFVNRMREKYYDEMK